MKPIDDPSIIHEALDCADLIAHSYAKPLRPDMVRKDGALFIAIKGTDCFRDMLVDANVRLARFGEFWAHHGFVDDYRLAWDGVLAEITRDPTRIVVCGHSLGGAVATLLAMEIRQSFPSLPVTVYTFGSPKVCTSPLAKWHDAVIKETYRIVHDKDLIPRVPAWGFTHVSGTIHLLENGRKASTPRRLWSKIREWLTFSFADLGDHSLSHYMIALQRRLTILERARAKQRGEL